MSTPGAGKQQPLDQPERDVLYDSDKQRRQAIEGSLTCLAQVTRYDIFYGFNQLVRAIVKPSNAHMVATKHALRYLAGTMSYETTYKKRGFALTAVSGSNSGNNPDIGKSMLPYILIDSNGPVNVTVHSD